MKWKCYTTIIDQLCEINYNGRVALMLSNEPLLDDRLEDMIVFAKAKSQRLFLDITTNGRLLTVELVVWGIERSGFFNGREKWAKGFENQRV